jgi:hypothetical protein
MDDEDMGHGLETQRDNQNIRLAGSKKFTLNMGLDFPINANVSVDMVRMVFTVSNTQRNTNHRRRERGCQDKDYPGGQSKL